MTSGGDGEEEEELHLPRVLQAGAAHAADLVEEAPEEERVEEVALALELVGQALLSEKQRRRGEEETR